MNNLSNEQEAKLNKLVSRFAAIYTDYFPDQLDENTVDDMTDDFHVMLMDQFVNPFQPRTDDE